FFPISEGRLNEPFIWIGFCEERIIILVSFIPMLTLNASIVLGDSRHPWINTHSPLLSVIGSINGISDLDETCLLFKNDVHGESLASWLNLV
ncbi:9297_t:CDS:2, partial [Funneliformis geosporum]